MRTINTLYNGARKHTLSFLGDGLTWSPNFGNAPHEVYPELVARKLRLYHGCDVKARNHGVAGDTSAQALQRVRTLFARETPDYLGILIGTDDTAITSAPVLTAGPSGSISVTAPAPWFAVAAVVRYAGALLGTVAAAVQLSPGAVGSIAVTAKTLPAAGIAIDWYCTSQGYDTAGHAKAAPLYWQSSNDGAGFTITTLPAAVTANQMPTATTQSNIRALVQAARAGVQGTVVTPSLLPSNAAPNTSRPPEARYLVCNDNDATGGLPTPSPVPNGPAVIPTVSGQGSFGPAIWISRYGPAGPAGWSRIAAPTASLQYAGGIPNVQVITTRFLNLSSGGDSVDSQNAADAAIRSAQQAAAAAEDCWLFDLWEYQNELVRSGQEPAHDDGWSCIPADPHPGFHGADTWSTGIVQDLEANHFPFVQSLVAAGLAQIA